MSSNVILLKFIQREILSGFDQFDFKHLKIKVINFLKNQYLNQFDINFEYKY